MQTTFKFSAGELNERLLRKVQKMFEGKSVTIIITTEQDETDYLLADPANKEHLEKALAEEDTATYSPEEFEKYAESLLKE